MDNKTKAILDEIKPNKFKEAAEKRQRVYKAIIENKNICKNKDLAIAAGYDMKDCYSDEYNAGVQFINALIRRGYIEKQKGRDGEDYFYITSKEPVLCDEQNSIERCHKSIYGNEEKAEDLLQEAIEREVSTEDYKSKEEPESLREARENFAKELADYEPRFEDEDAEEEPLYSGVLNFGQSGSRGHIEVKFVEKSRAEIIDIISNLNLEDIL